MALALAARLAGTTRPVRPVLPPARLAPRTANLLSLRAELRSVGTELRQSASSPPVPVGVVERLLALADELVVTGGSVAVVGQLAGVLAETGRLLDIRLEELAGGLPAAG